METDGKINFSNLESVINIGTKCIGKILGEDIGFLVSSVDREIDEYGQKLYVLTGKIIAPYGIYKFRADGRVIVDPIGFNKKMPSYTRTYGLTICEDVSEDLMFMCYPFVNGFSFTTKEWGEMYVCQLDDIKFDDNAFDYLIMDESIKKMIKALVINSEGHKPLYSIGCGELGTSAEILEKINRNT